VLFPVAAYGGFANYYTNTQNACFQKMIIEPFTGCIEQVAVQQAFDPI